MEQNREILKKHMIRATRYRLAVLEVLLEQRDRFVAIDEIHQRLGQVYDSFDFSTAYRTLELFEEKQLVYKTRIGDKICYTWRCETQKAHHHLICRQCGKKVTLDFCPFEELEAQVGQFGFESFEHMRDFFGVCETCKNA